jgi:hypothetical protein
MGTIAAYAAAAALTSGRGGSPPDASTVYGLGYLLLSLTLYAAALPDYLAVASEAAGYVARVGELREALVGVEGGGTMPAADERSLTVGGMRLALPFTAPRTYLVGPSGAGKSTALRAVLAAGAAPTSTVFVPQMRYILPPPASLLDSIAYPATAAEGLDRATALLSAVGLLQPAIAAFNRCRPSSLPPCPAGEVLCARGFDWPAVLSGGERARLALARAMYAQPALIVADEPFVGLDAAARSVCWSAVEGRGVPLVALTCAP